MHMSSQRYINAASEYKYICILIYNTFCSATFYNDPPMITHAVAQELGPQEVKGNIILRRWYTRNLRWFQEFILHNMMSIFTFMGTNLLQQDDSYSFHVITMTMRTIIPALIKVTYYNNVYLFRVCYIAPFLS